MPSRHFFVAFVLAAFCAQASAVPLARQANETYDWLQQTRQRINAAGQTGDSAALRSIRGQINSQLAHWDGARRHPCARALSEANAFLQAVDADRPKRTRDEIAERFRDRLDVCHRSYQP